MRYLQVFALENDSRETHGIICANQLIHVKLFLELFNG